MIISVFRKLQTDLSKKENCKPKLLKERNSMETPTFCSFAANFGIDEATPHLI